jgi:hypothetical protein
MNRLGHRQTAAMFTLMALAREVSNTELETIVGFRLSGQDRIELNDLRYVTSKREGGGSYVHELTKQGLEWCRTELAAVTSPPPRPRSLLVPALYILLAGLDEYLRRESLGLADVFRRNVELKTEEIEHRIRTAYQKLTRAPRDWVGLVDLRPLLGDIPTEKVDAVLKELSRTRQAHLVPESNRKALREADHEAAIRIGGEDNHLISFEAS